MIVRIVKAFGDASVIVLTDAHDRPVEAVLYDAEQKRESSQMWLIEFKDSAEPLYSSARQIVKALRFDAEDNPLLPGVEIAILETEVYRAET